eukprot:gene5906-8149_t
MSEFEVFVSKSDFKFNCAHFIAFNGFRERIHGHNYRLSVRVVGAENIQEDGYVIDFGDIKKATRELCKDLNEYFIVPTLSKDIAIFHIDNQVCLECQDGSKFSFPKSDCAMLPLLHSSAEELSHYFWCSIVKKIGLEKLHSRSIKSLEVSVAEAPMQAASFRSIIPTSLEELEIIEGRIRNIRPTACFNEDYS